MRYLIVFLALSGLCSSAWDYPAAKDMTGNIVAVPVSVYKEYGFSLETTCFYNIERILLALRTTQAEVLALKDQMKALLVQVAEMKKAMEKPEKVVLPPGYSHIVDPNEVAE